MNVALVSIRFWRLFCTDCCPLGLLLGGSKCSTISIGRAIGGMEFVHCTEVIRLSESPLLEVSLNSQALDVASHNQCNHYCTSWI